MDTVPRSQSSPPNDAASRRIAGRWFRRAAVAAAVLVGIHLLWVYLGIGGDFGTLVFTDVEQSSLALLASVACGFAGLRSRNQARRGWSLLAAGMAAWAAGQLVWSYDEVVLGIAVPFPSLADAGFLAMVPLSVAGFALMIEVRHRALRVLFDGLIVSASLTIVSWPLVLGPTLQAEADTRLAFELAVAYPIGDIVIATMAFVLLSQTTGPARAPIALAGTGMLCLGAADSGFGYLVLHHAYAAGNLVELGWISGFLLVALAGLRVVTVPGPASQRAGSGPLLVGLPYLPLTAAMATGVVIELVGREDTPMVVIGVALVLLVVARQFLTVRENLVLTRRLGSVVDDLRRREEELRRLAFHDPLTGLANRALFQHEVERAVSSQSRTGALLGLVYIDLDGFKAVNDTLGHAAGDALLVAVAHRLRRGTRPGDTVARLGGDEFAMLLEYFQPTDGEADAMEVARRVVAELSEPFQIDGEEIRIGASTGVAVAAPGRGEAASLVRDADMAMYAAKIAGKGRVARFEPRLRDQIATAAAA